MTNDSKPKVTPVSVTVDPQTHAITCLPNPVAVTCQNGLIGFNLETPGYAFKPRNAIVLSEPNSDFPYPSWTVNAAVATLLDLNVGKESFEYSVYVVDTATGQEYSVDPIIENGGSAGGEC